MQENLNNFVNVLFNDDFSYLGGACFALKIEGGSLFAHRAGGTTYVAHSLELKVKLKLAIVERGKNFILIFNEF